MKRAIAKLGARAIPGNTKLGYALKAWRKELIDDLGGEDNVSVQQRAIVELASTTKLMISSIDAWIMSQPSLITRSRALMPVILQRQQLASFCRKTHDFFGFNSSTSKEMLSFQGRTSCHRR